MCTHKLLRNNFQGNASAKNCYRRLLVPCLKNWIFFSLEDGLIKKEYLENFLISEPELLLKKSKEYLGKHILSKNQKRLLVLAGDHLIIYLDMHMTILSFILWCRSVLLW